jgi:hypothetical protein
MPNTPTDPDFVNNTGVYPMFSAAAANGTVVVDLGKPEDDVSIEIETTGSPTFSLTLTGSDDNSGYASLGSALVATGTTKISFSTTGPVRYIKGVLASLSGGTFTAKLGVVRYGG